MAIRPIENVISVPSTTDELGKAELAKPILDQFFKLMTDSAASISGALFGRKSVACDTAFGASIPHSSAGSTARSQTRNRASLSCSLSLTVITDKSSARLVSVNPGDQAVTCGQLAQGMVVVEDQLFDLNAALCQFPDVLTAHSMHSVELVRVTDRQAANVANLPVVDSGASFYPLMNGQGSELPYGPMQDALPA